MASQSDHLPEYSAEASERQQPTPEALPGLDDLKGYKRILKEGLKNLPKEAIPEKIKDNNIKDMETLQGDLREKIEKGIKSSKHKSTREKLHISADAVAINANQARGKLSIIISMVNTYKAPGTSPAEKAQCVDVLHTSLGECRDTLQKALAQFSKVSL